MKKSLLLIAAVATALCAGAQKPVLQAQPVAVDFPNGPEVKKTPSMATGSVWFSYSEDPYYRVGYQAGYFLAGAMEIDAETATKFAGVQIDRISFALHSPNDSTATIFISESITAAPAITKTVAIANTDEWQEFTFDTPYTITAGKPVYVGYIYQQNTADSYPVFMDGNTTSTDPGGLLAIGTTADGCFGSFYDYTSNYGMVCIKAGLTGEFKDIDATVIDMYAPERVNAGKEFSAEIELRNFSASPITTATVEYTLDGVTKTVEANAETPIAFGTVGTVTISGLSIASVSTTAYTMTAKVTKVNGADYALEQVSDQIICTPFTVEPKMVVEEFTSTKCGYCPVGIVGMEFMKFYYPRQFIPIAVHSTGMGTDEMTYKPYQTGMYDYTYSYPSCLTNRNVDFATYPSSYYLYNSYLDDIQGSIAAAEVDMKAEWYTVERSAADITVTSKYDLDYAAANFRWALVMTEDSVGPYSQTNYYAGSSSAPGDWGSMGSSQSWLYDDVARYISTFSGDASSVPAAITAGQEYTYTTRVPVYDLQNAYGNVVDVNADNIHFVALLLDATTGEVVQAVTIPSADVAANTSGLHYQRLYLDGEFESSYVIGDSVEIDARSTMDLPVSVAVTSGDATYADGVLKFNGAGTVVITLSQAGNDNVLPAADVTVSFVVKQDQIITWDQDLSQCEVGQSYELNATASSGGTVTYKVVDGSAGRISLGKLRFSKEGTVTLRASQAGNDTYAPAYLDKVCSTTGAGIETITIDDVKDSMVFDLDGRQVTSPQSGRVYIVIRDSRAAKVLVK